MNDLFEYINQNDIFGVSLDIFAHFFVGMFITIVGLMLRISFSVVLIFLFGIELTKELSDYLNYNSPISENIKDFFFTFLYPLILAPVRIHLKNEENNRK
jgi:uncharacterized BrkB/YihY/UPF0761 family membrane protein